ncbi:F-box/LRR-repeat protein 12, partial [Ancistrocladus abbreviatus]
MNGLSSAGPTTIMDLPDDCVIFIFQRLCSAFAREAFGLTCRRWLHIQNISRRSLMFQCSFTHLEISSLSK